MAHAHRVGIAMILSTVLIVAGVWQEVSAGKPLYSYLDERGNLVATDRLEDVPDRYRDKVRITESVVNSEPPSRWGSILAPPASAEELLVRILGRVPAQLIPGLTAYQSVMLLGGFFSILLMYGIGRLSRETFLPLLMPWAIGFLLVGTMYFMFVSDLSDKVAARFAEKSSGSLVHRFHEQSKHLAEQKEQRMKRFDRTQE